jgi:hypothetical protein
MIPGATADTRFPYLLHSTAEWRLLLAGGRVIVLFPSGGDGPNPVRVWKGRGFRIAEAIEIA